MAGGATSPTVPQGNHSPSNAGIVLPGKRFYWIEADTHQAAVAAKVEGNTIEVKAARVRRLTFHLSDRLLDLGRPVVIRVNGQVVHDKVLSRSLVTAVEDAALLNDTEHFSTARITVEVPDLAAGCSTARRTGNFGFPAYRARIGFRGVSPTKIKPSVYQSEGCRESAQISGAHTEEVTCVWPIRKSGWIACPFQP